MYKLRYKQYLILYGGEIIEFEGEAARRKPCDGGPAATRTKASISVDIAREGRSSQPKLRLRVPLKKPPTKVSRGPNTPASERKPTPKNLIAVTTNASSLHRSETLRVPPLQAVEETVPRRRCISKGTAIPFERSAAAKTQTFQSEMETLAPITDKRFLMSSLSSPNRSPSSYSRRVTRAPDLA
ncbi:hypothetical protein DY000_02018265 [Brassica cretica]|uniref:Uncharacterized protein n=1 Tax=Brassica cretica TaxID=69181 RepID=A0ABQ7CV92_BRACR|nr:hypothetical protein DY000_02018265 [Brassica cretica]